VLGFLNQLLRIDMSEMPHAERFFDLVVYQYARELQQTIFKVSAGFPAEEKYSLTDQIRRSSRSIGAQIAEAWAKRDYVKHFISKLSDADGEQMETQHWITTAVDCGYVDRATGTQLFQLCLRIGRMVGGMKEKADQFCPKESSHVREPDAEYFRPSPNELPFN
jgi:four helix bundle protein